MFLHNIHRAFTAIVFSSIALAACTGKRMARNSVVLDTITVTGKTAGLKLYREASPIVWDISHTRVALNFDWKAKTADGIADIKLHPYFYATDTIELDAKTMRIDSVGMVDKGNISKLTYTHADDVLKIKLPKLYKAEDTLNLHIVYKSMPYSAVSGGSDAIVDDRGLYFINTDYAIPGKPAQIWTQGETEANSHWMPTIDKPNQKFTTQIELTVPDSFTTLSNGYLADTRSSNGKRTDIWQMDQRIQAYAVMLSVGKFEVVKQEWQGKPVHYYVEPAFAPYAKRMFEHTPEMMEYFNKVTGVEYPWNKYSQVVVRDYVSGAMENTSASLFGEFMNQNARELADKDNEDIVSHELFHQWFGDYVTAESWSNLTMNESFATYGEQLWRNYKYGKASADLLAYQETTRYLSQAQSNDPSLVRYHYSEREEMFDRVSYQKGSVILRYLHGLMGDEGFSKAMQLYLTRHALGNAEAHQWRLAIEEVTGRDWQWYFNQWYYRGGHPVLDVAYDYDDAEQKVYITVTQKQDSLYTLPVKAGVWYDSTETVADWNITERKQYFTYNYKNGVKPNIVPDKLNWIPGTITETKLTGYWLRQYINSKYDVLNRLRALEVVSKKMDDSNAKAIILLALDDKEPTVREMTLAIFSRVVNKKRQDEWKSQVAFMAVNDGNNGVRGSAFDVLGAWKVTSAKEEMLAAVSDSSYRVAGAALLALKRINEKDTAYALAKQLLPTKPKASLHTNAWQIVGDRGRAEDISLFEQEANYVYGTQKISFGASLASYEQNVNSLTSFQKALQLHKGLIKAESIRPYRLSLGLYLFETANWYKQSVRDSRTNPEKALNEQKFEMLKTAAKEMMENEKEKDNLKQYRPAMKRIFG